MEKLGRIDVIVLNSHGVGQVCHIKRLPRRGETLEATNWRVEEDGGKGCTVSVALGRLSISTGYIGKVGYDPWGDLGDKWMTEAGVNTTFMYRDHSVSTGTGLIMKDEEGYNTIVDGDSACQALTWEEIHNAIEAMKEARFFISGFGMPFRKALDGVKIAKEEYGMLTLCNISPLPSEHMGTLSYLDFMVLNDVEARALLSLPEDTVVSWKEIMKRLIGEYCCRGVIMTCGEQGSAVLDGQEYFEIQSIPVQVVDTVGAGDGYLAALTAGLVWGKTLRESCEFAAQYSALKVQRQGTIPGYPFLADVEAFIKTLS
jgi:ribokinase